MLNMTQDSSPLLSSLSPPGVGGGATTESNTSPADSAPSQSPDPAWITQPSRATQNRQLWRNHPTEGHHPSSVRDDTRSTSRSPRFRAQCTAHVYNPHTPHTTSSISNTLHRYQDEQEGHFKTITPAFHTSTHQSADAISPERATTTTTHLDPKPDGNTAEAGKHSVTFSYMEPPPRRSGHGRRSAYHPAPITTTTTTTESVAAAAMMGVQRPLGLEHQLHSHQSHYTDPKRSYTTEFVSSRRASQFGLSDDGFVPGMVGVGGLEGQEQIEDIESPEQSHDDVGSGLDIDDGAMAAMGYESRSARHRAHTQTGDDSEQQSGWNDSKTKAGKERKRLPLACIMCRRKKIRCSGEKPGCKHCLRSRIPCVYKQTTRKTAPRTDYMAMLERRLKRMEERLLKHVPKDEISSILATTGRSVVRPTSTSSKKRSASTAFEDDSELWGSAGRSSKQIALEGPSNTALPAKSTEDDADDGSSALPRKDIQEHLVEVYFDCLYGQPYLLLHKSSFLRRLRNGTIPPILVLAVCAVSARFSKHPAVRHDPPFLSGESFATEARRLVLKNFDSPSITNLTACLLLAVHEFGTCHGGRSWALGGMAIRMAQALKLHKEVDSIDISRKHLEKISGDELSDEPVSFIDQEIRRRCMWACFLLDRFHTAGADRPWVFQENDMAIQLPVHDRNLQLDSPAITERLDGGIKDNSDVEPEEKLARSTANMGLGGYIIKIVALYSRVTKYLHQGAKDKELRDIWDPQSHHSELEGELQQFIDDLPDKFRYTPENISIHATDKNLGSFVLLHVIYHTVLLDLQRPVLMEPSDSVPKHVASRASEVSLDASSRIAEVLQEANDRGAMITTPFLGFCAFNASLVHLLRMFYPETSTQQEAKRHLESCLRFLLHIKQYWGLFHSITDKLKSMYQKFSEAAKTSGISSEHHDIARNEILQYGDWFMEYTYGIILSEDPATGMQPLGTDSRRYSKSSDAALSSVSDLQTADEFFARLNPRDGERNRARPAPASTDSFFSSQPQQQTKSPHQTRKFSHDLAAESLASPLSLPHTRSSASRTPASSHSQQNPSPAPSTTPSMLPNAGESGLSDAISGDMPRSGTTGNTHRRASAAAIIDHQTAAHGTFPHGESTTPRMHMHHQQHEPHPQQFSAFSPATQTLAPNPVPQLTNAHSEYSRALQQQQEAAAAYLFEPYPGGSDSSLMAALSTGLWQGFEQSGVGPPGAFVDPSVPARGQADGAGIVPTSRAGSATAVGGHAGVTPEAPGAWFMGYGSTASDYGAVDGLGPVAEASNQHSQATPASSRPGRKFSSSTEYQQQR